MTSPPVPSPVEYTRGKETGYYSSHYLARGGVDEESGNGAPVKCGWEDVAFQTRRNLDEIREVNVPGYPRVNVHRTDEVDIRSVVVFSKDVASGQRQNGVFERDDPRFTLPHVQEV